MKKTKFFLWTSILPIILFIILLIHYLYFCFNVENPGEIKYNGDKIYITYEALAKGRGSEALTTIWRNDVNGRKNIIKIFRSVDSDNHLGAVSPRNLYYFDCNDDGKKDLCSIETNSYVDLDKEVLIEQYDIKLPFLYQSYIKSHNGWPFNFPKYSYILPILITSIIFWLLLSGISYFINLLISSIKNRKTKKTL